MRLFRIDGPVYRFLETITNLLLLNLLFLVCSIPIVTIGPSLTATYYVTLKMIRNEETNIFKNFFQSFRTNFKQGMILGIGVLLLLAILLIDIRALTYLTTIPEDFAKVLVFVVGFLLLIVTAIAVYLFAVLAQFDNKSKELIKWSAIIALRHLPVTLLFLLIVAIPILIMYLRPAVFLQIVFPIMLLAGFAGIAYIQSYFLVRVFSYYIPKEEEDSQEDEEEDIAY